MPMIQRVAVVLLMAMALVSCNRGAEISRPLAEEATVTITATADEGPMDPATEPVETLEPTALPEATARPPIPDNVVAEGAQFSLVSPQPIIEAGDGGDWSRPLHNAGAITYHEGQFHMFRNGYPSLPGNAAIGYATSTDGVHWSHYEDNPVFRTQDVAYAEQMIMASSVHVEGDGTWVMYFLIWDAPTTPGAIGRATAPSPEGPWTADPEPVLLPGSEGTWDSQQVTQPIVLPNDFGDGYIMYYTGIDDEGVERIGMATSADGIAWNRYDDRSTISEPIAESDPVLDIGAPGQWDEQGVARGRVVRTADGYTMIYRAPAQGLGFSYGLAMSEDGIDWVKYAGNPILKRGDIPNARGLFFPTLIHHAGTLYFYIEAYRGSSRIHLLTSGEPPNEAATSDLQAEKPLDNLVALDLANRGGASDIEVRFDLPQGAAGRQELRVMLVKAARSSLFGEQMAAGLSEPYFVTPSEVGPAVRFRLPSELVDVDGDAVVEGTPYFVYVLSRVTDGHVLYGPSAELTLANEAAVRTLIPELPSATGGLAVDGEGNLYAANIGRAPSRNGSEIFRISPDGAYQLWVEDQEIRGASGNVFDPQGNLLQSSLRANTIHRITTEGFVSEFTKDGLRSPVGLALAPDGTVYVANCGNNSIQQITAAGESQVFASSPLFSCPNGITLDEAGNLYVANFSNGDVIKIAPSGEASHFVELPGNNNGHIYYLDGLLYVVARGGHQIYAATLDGKINLLAGTSERGHRDGPALQATFSLPNDIVASPDGSVLYVNEVLPTSGTANLPSVIRIIELPRDN